MSLLICGLGIHPRLDATLEVLAGLEACDAVFTDLEDAATASWLAHFGPQPQFCKDAKAVLREAAHKKIGLAVWGHPQLTSPLARAVLKSAKDQNIETHCLPGVGPASSAFSRSLSFFGDSYGHPGMRCYELSTYLDAGKFTALKLPLTIFSQQAEQGLWKRLAAALSKSYGPNHKAHVFTVGAPDEKILPLNSPILAALSGALVMIPPVNPQHRSHR